MPSNLDRYTKDLDALIARGDLLDVAMRRECTEGFDESFLKTHGEGAKKLLQDLPSFRAEYQSWYSEAKSLIRQILPDRLDDLVRHYEKPKSRKELSSENYRIEDYLQGLTATRGFDRQPVVGLDAAIPHFTQQLAIVKAVKRRLESSLFDIRQLVQADVFDSELDAAKELAKRGFARAAGALAGVVLERHLGLVAGNHAVKLSKKTPTIADFNDALKQADVIDVPRWRSIQHLADIRNLCDHNKSAEPTREQVDDLIAGVDKTIKTLF